MDHRSQAARNARDSHRDDAHLAPRGKTPELEIREVLTPPSRCIDCPETTRRSAHIISVRLALKHPKRPVLLRKFQRPIRPSALFASDPNMPAVITHDP